MATRPRLIITAMALALASIACQAISGPSVENQSSLPAGEVLFKDDFSDTSSGWDRVTTANGVTDYVDGSYRIYVNEPNTDTWANPGLNFGDVQIAVDVTKKAGPDDNDFGVMCRVQAQDQYYFFIISSDGYYGIGKVNGEQQAVLGAESMQPSEAIHQGSATNHMQATCIGDELSLTVNDQLLFTVQDADFSSGDVGLIAGTFTEPGTDIYFDNFLVMKP